MVGCVIFFKDSIETEGIPFIADEHERRCGGKFEKIKEPENYKAQGSKKRTANKQNESQPSTSRGKDQDIPSSMAD